MLGNTTNCKINKGLHMFQVKLFASETTNRSEGFQSGFAFLI